MLECIRASMEAKPATWSKDWKAEKVPMADIEIKTHEQIVAEILARRLKQLRRQPLIKKLNPKQARWGFPPFITGLTWPDRWLASGITLVDT